LSLEYKSDLQNQKRTDSFSIILTDGPIKNKTKIIFLSIPITMILELFPVSSMLTECFNGKLDFSDLLF